MLRIEGRMWREGGSGNGRMAVKWRVGVGDGLVGAKEERNKQMLYVQAGEIVTDLKIVRQCMQTCPRIACLRRYCFDRDTQCDCDTLTQTCTCSPVDCNQRINGVPRVSGAHLPLFLQVQLRVR